MTSEREAIYDAEIGPALLRVAKQCEVAGISLVCKVEWAAGEGARTVTMQPDASIDMRALEMVARPPFNIDALAIALARHICEHKIPHNSIVMSQCGVDPDPANRE